MNIFLKLKHWQLFGLLLCTYFVFQIAGTTTVISSQSAIKQVSEHNFFVFKTSTVISSQEIAREVSTDIPRWEKSVKISKSSPSVILFLVVLLGWFYAVAVNLNKKLPDTVKMNLTKFKWFFFIPITYGFLFYLFTYFVLFNRVSNGEQLNWEFSVLVIVLSYLFSVFCLFYCIYFNAKLLKAVELQRPVTFRDYVLEFVLFWLFPIGIWLIQPRINRIFSETT
jgi:hypothetical protein